MSVSSSGFRACPVVPFSTFEDSEQLFNSTAGSRYGYYLHRTPPGHVLHLLEEKSAAKRKLRLDTATISRRVRQYFKKQVDYLVGEPGADTLPHLTPREHQVMTHLCRGALDKEIAELLQHQRLDGAQPSQEHLRKTGRPKSH